MSKTSRLPQTTSVVVQNANAALNAPQDEWPALGLTMLEQGQAGVLHARST